MQLHEGVKKSGIMGFCDPCPGEPKQLYVEYTFYGNNFEVIVFYLAFSFIRKIHCYLKLQSKC